MAGERGKRRKRAAKKLGVDESGEAFERAMRELLKPKPKGGVN
jgi:hypothetical protein